MTDQQAPEERMKKSRYLRAARYLDQYADEIFNGQSAGGKWVIKDASDRLAKREHDSLRALAQELRIGSKGKP